LRHFSSRRHFFFVLFCLALDASLCSRCETIHTRASRRLLAAQPANPRDQNRLIRAAGPANQNFAKFSSFLVRVRYNENSDARERNGLCARAPLCKNVEVFGLFWEQIFWQFFTPKHTKAYIHSNYIRHNELIMNIIILSLLTASQKSDTLARFEPTIFCSVGKFSIDYLCRYQEEKT
jgi:hypothetical protein